MISTQPKQRILKVRPLREIQALLENQNYKEYYERRQKLLDSFGKKISEMNREEYRVWLHHVSALIYEPEGSFSKFLWENMPEDQKVKMDKKARGPKPRNKDWWKDETPIE